MNLKKVLMSALVAVPVTMAAQPQVMGSDAAGYLERGRNMYEARNYVGAIDQLEQMKRLPASASMREQADYYLALSHFERGEAASLAMLQAFIERYPSSPLVPEAQLKVGNYYFYRGQWESALLSYSLVPGGALDLDNGEDLEYRRAYCNLRLGDYDAAERQYMALDRTARYAGACEFYKAYLDYVRGDYRSARDRFAAIPAAGELGYQSQYYMAQIDYINQRYTDVIAQGTALLEQGANDYFDAELTRLVGESHYRNGNEAQARVYLRRYFEFPDEEPYRTAAYIKGALDYKDGKWADVVDDMLHVTGGSDALAQSAYLYIGQAKRQLGDIGGANAAFEASAMMDCDREVKETAFYNYAVGVSQDARNPFDKSVGLFETFINEYPKSRYQDEVEGYLVDAYMNTTDYNRALASIQRVKQPGARVLRAKQVVLYNLGVQALSANRNDDAVTYLKDAIAVGNYDKTALNESRLWLAEAQYRGGKYKEAAKYQQEYLSNTDKTDDNYGQAQYDLGYSLYQQSRYAEAKKAFEAAIASKSLNTELVADAYNRIGDAQYQLRDFTGAQASYDQAMALDKTAGDHSMLQKGLAMGMARNYADEVKQMDALIKAYPNSTLIPQAMLEKANTQALMGNNQDALATYDALLRQYPRSAEARKGMLQTALVNQALGRHDAAVEAYKQVIKQYPASDEAIAAVEDLKLIYADRGQLAELGKFLATVPNAPKLNTGEVERLTFEAAEKAAIGDNPAIGKIQQYLKDYPDGAYAAKAKYYIARYYYGKGDLNKATAALDEALQAGSDASYAQDIYAMRSDILQRQGKLDEALQAYKDLADRATSDDNRTVAQMGAMRVAKQMGEWREVQALATALLQSGALTAAEEKEVTLNRALALAQQGNIKDAMTPLRALAADPASEVGAQASCELSRIQYETGDYKGAEKTVNDLINAGTPHSYWLAKSFLTLADAYYKQGKVAEARDYLQSLKSNYPGNEKDIFNEIDSRLAKWKNAKPGAASSTGGGKDKPTRKR